jgi:hypothetical protein
LLDEVTWKSNLELPRPNAKLGSGIASSKLHTGKPLPNLLSGVDLNADKKSNLKDGHDQWCQPLRAFRTF